MSDDLARRRSLLTAALGFALLDESAPALRAIRAGELLSSEDRGRLAMFMAVQLTRVPVARRITETLLPGDEKSPAVQKLRTEGDRGVSGCGGCGASRRG